MITFLKTIDTAGGLYVEGFCLEADYSSLPVMNIANGSKMEMLVMKEADDDAGDDAIPEGSIEELQFNASVAEWLKVNEPAASGGGGGSALPEVTAEDNGDVLTVVDGAWGKAAPSGGVLIVNAATEGSTTTLDKTFGEIYAAGMAVVKCEHEGYMVYYPVDELGRNISTGEIAFRVESNLYSGSENEYPSYTEDDDQ